MTTPPSPGPSAPGPPVVLTARAGVWLLGALAPEPDPSAPAPPLAAHWRPGGLDDALLALPTTGAVVPSSWAFENYLGRRLPDAVHRAVGARAAVLAAPEVALLAGRPEGATPDPAGPLLVPGQPPVSYRRALAASRPATGSWRFPGLADPREEITIEMEGLAAAKPEHPTPADENGRLVVAYRVAVDGAVLTAGADLEVPADTDLAADSTVRGLVTMVFESDPDALAMPGHDVLGSRADEITSLVLDPPQPHPPGTRVTVLAPRGPGEGWTGTVVKAYHDRENEVRSYAVHPDTADLPGHRWYGQAAARATKIAPAGQVRATLAGPDTGLDPADPHRGITYGARVSYLADDDTIVHGTVIAVRQDRDGERRYLVRADGDNIPFAVSAADCVPRAGTAWPDTGTLLAARAADPHPLAAGEILTASAVTIEMVTDAQGRLVPQERDGPSAPMESRPTVAPSPAGSAASAQPGRVAPASRDGPAPPSPAPLAGETFTVNGDAHGLLTVDRAAFQTWLTRDPDLLRKRLADDVPELALTGAEQPVTLAALAAHHLPAPGTPRPPALAPPAPWPGLDASIPPAGPPAAGLF